MALLTPLPEPQARSLLRRFGIELSRLRPLADGSVNSNFEAWADDGRHFFVRLFEEQGPEGARAERALAMALAEAGVPTPVPLAGPELTHAGKPLAVYPWIEGESLCQKRVTPGHCQRLGAALAGVHTARVEQLPSGRFGAEQLSLRLDRIEIEARPELRAAAVELRRRLRDQLSRRDAELPEGLIHGDLFRDNVLWRGPEIAALIDFESAARGTFVYDLMVCVHAWCYGDAFDLELVSALLEGYAALRRPSPRELSQLKTQGALAALRFCITRITDYSMRAEPGQAPKRDFERFVARLDALEGGVLDPALSALRVG